jgi:hypothetical protein
VTDSTLKKKHRDFPAALVLLLSTSFLPWAQGSAAIQEQQGVSPPRVVQAKRFLTQRGIAPNRFRRPGLRKKMEAPPSQSVGTATWQAIGPLSVTSLSYGLVTGRVSALALDPSDLTGNRLYLGATGGGVWLSQDAGSSNPASVAFLPLTDTVAALGGAADASISIGALTVQPGATGVILAGTGDPDDALDSYYGAGILRSADGGNTWSLIEESADSVLGQSGQNFRFTGEGFAGFAWSTDDPQTVVAAVSQAYEGTLVNADSPQESYEGLYYSSDSGVSWHLAVITDGNGLDVQGPLDHFTSPDGNAATAVVWNPWRHLFVAAVRFHGYYESADGITFTRMAAQPGAGLSTQLCPTNGAQPGSTGCPIFRGALAVDPVTGDTFAWTVDLNNQDQGLWQDACALSNGACANRDVTFARQWNTSPLESNNSQGPATIANGDYNLVLAAVPQAQDTLLLAGGNDLWRCSLAAGCAWRDTTNTNTCMSAQVAGYQHALAWSTANPQEIFLGNDGGLWRSTDAIGETGPACAATDSSHFQNLNGTLGSLAEVESLAQSPSEPDTVMAGIGANGTAGVKVSAPVAHWPQMLAGEGGPVAIDPNNSARWFANNQAGVSIHVCAQYEACTPAAFGAEPVVNDADVDGDGLTMTTPAPFLVDPLDHTQLLIGTCRVWRGPADGSGWSTGNAVSPILDGAVGNVSCNGDALIRSMAAMATGAGSEVVYVGMFGAADGGSVLPGHILSAVLNPSSIAPPVWQDLTLNPVAYTSQEMNAFGHDISSIFIDPHDPSGNTVYVTVEGFHSIAETVAMVYGSTDGGAHWTGLSSNLVPAPANSILVDPQDANTVYLATDAGVFSTRQIATCANVQAGCWSAFGTGLPLAPVITLAATAVTAPEHLLTAGTYGRGVWQIPLWTAGTELTTATALPVSLIFPSQASGTASSAKTVTLKNTGTVNLAPGVIALTGDFSATGNCQGASVTEDSDCSIQVSFTPAAPGTRTGLMTIGANVAGGQLTVMLSGTGIQAGAVSLLPSTVNFGQVEMSAISAPLQVEAENNGETAISGVVFGLTGPFVMDSNTCGSQLAAGAQCQLLVEFAPTLVGASTGTLTMTEGAQSQTAELTGVGVAPPGDTLSANALAFPATVSGQLSSPLVLVLTNGGGLSLTSIGTSVSAPFQVSSNCGTLLPAHSSCAISVVFAPATLGSQTGTLVVSDSLRQQTVTLSGTGVMPGVLAVTPSALSFTAQKVGVGTLPQTLTVRNTGQAPIANVGFEMLGPFSPDFATGATTCGATLPSGGSCIVKVTFTPSSTGGSAAFLAISSTSAGVAQVLVLLSGTCTVATGLNVNPTQLTFPAVIAGQSSAPQTVTIANNGGHTLTSLVLSSSAPFNIVQNNCPASLAPGTQCTAGIVFQPSVTGPIAGGFTVVSGAVGTPATVALIGTGAAPPGIQMLPGLLTFPEVTGVGSTSSPLNVTLTNTGTVITLTGLQLEITGTFMLVNNTCTSPLGPTKSCTAGVEFMPAIAEPEQGTLSASAQGVSTARVLLTGTGFDFTVKPSAATSVTVANGQTAYYTLIISPLNGEQGTFTFNCGTLPANAMCIFAPSTDVVAAGTTGYQTVQVATGLSSTSARSRGPAGWQLLSLACGLLMLPLAWRRRRNALLLAALLAILVAGISSCLGASGSSVSQPPAGPGATPAGTYSIPVTVQSNGVQHQVTLTLTVD